MRGKGRERAREQELRRPCPQVHELEEYRRERLEDLAVLVQKTYRGWRQRQLYRTMRAAQITIATTWRSWKVSRAGVALVFLSSRVGVPQSVNAWCSSVLRTFPTPFFN